MTRISVTLGVVLLVTGMAQAAERAGEAARVQPNAHQREGFWPSQIDQGDEIYREANLYTGDYGSLDIAFDDGSKLTLGPRSDIVVDEYVYAPGSSTGRAVISLTKGALRMVSGRLSSDSYRVQTPVATIGVRGTDFTLDTSGAGRVRIWVDDGTVTAQPVQSGTVFEFTAPAFAICTASSCDRSPPDSKPAAYPEPPDPQDRDGAGDGGGSH